MGKEVQRNERVMIRHTSSQRHRGYWMVDNHKHTSKEN
jgi:hypothetical protein